MQLVCSTRKIVLAVLVGGLAGLALSGPASADPTYSVMNADGGIYWRSAPDWNTPVAIAGNGVYNGSIVSVHCYQAGTSVPGSADIMWEQATVVGGPGRGSGWLNEHFINDGQPINQPSPGVPPCNAPPPPPPPPAPPVPAPPTPTPPASDPLTFSIYNADGGIYYRSSPHWSDTPQTPGVGVYNGDQVKLICGASGDAVGPGNNTAWSYVTNSSRNVGNGWVSEHFINDDLQPNQWPTGLPQCGSDIPGASGGNGSTGGGAPSTGASTGGAPATSPRPGGSLYYSPYSANPEGHPTGWVKSNKNLTGQHWTYAPSPAGVTMNYGDWSRNNDSKGCPSLDSFIPSASQGMSDDGTHGPFRITTVASWSLARLAPLLLFRDFQNTGRPSWVTNINYMLLFDPGTQEDFSSSKCAREYAVPDILRDWLAAKTSNILVVLSGLKTADAGHHSKDGKGHAGIQDGLFSDVKKSPMYNGRDLRKQIIVCNYDTMEHWQVWQNFSVWMDRSPITLSTCPVDPRTGKRPSVSWNP